MLAIHDLVTRPAGALAWALALVCAVALLAGCTGPAARRDAGLVQAPVRIDPAEREASVARALLLVNTPYRYGGNTPESGFDCSGLVGYVLAQGARQPLPRSSVQWAAASAQVAEPQRGDLVFFNTGGGPYSHMGIYVGGGQFVHAPSSGGTVRKDRLDSSYFAGRYTGARSVFQP
ncbi:MAG: C40 family peptidase [Burkholderiaceae bacterium]|nr:C40 family peptidase [Burkholderiaceae bacterium]